MDLSIKTSACIYCKHKIDNINNNELCQLCSVEIERAWELFLTPPIYNGSCKECNDSRFCEDCGLCRNCVSDNHRECEFAYEKSCTVCNYRQVCIYCCLCMEEHDGKIHIPEKCISGGPHVNKMNHRGWFDKKKQNGEV